MKLCEKCGAFNPHPVLNPKCVGCGYSFVVPKTRQKRRYPGRDFAQWKESATAQDKPERSRQLAHDGELVDGCYITVPGGAE